ncbi:MAG: GGDEF domain-containing protein [Gaiellaceae bacterium]
MAAQQGRAQSDDGFARLAVAIREAAWELALGVVHEGIREDTVPSLTRIDELERLGDIPAFIGELGSHVVNPEPGRIRPGGRLAEVARSHARNREALGFAPNEVVLELLLLRRVVWRFVTSRQELLGEMDVLVAERRLDDLIDTLVVECVVAYFERATAELSDRARRDPLTGLLNHHAFWSDLDREFDRAQRYGHGLTFVVVDLDHFKTVNDTRGHPVGDRVLRCVADALSLIARSSDLVARIGGDEFAVALVETDAAAGEVFGERLRAAVAERCAAAELPDDGSFTAGFAHFPSDASGATALFELADSRLYDHKRARA